MTDKAWKAQERIVAAKMGSRRNPNTGESRIDIDAGPFAVEHKARRRLPGWLTGALRQARDGADGRTPIVGLSQVRQGVKAERYVLLSLEDWLDWHEGRDDD